MNELKIFQNPEFGAVRTIIIDDEVWFVGNDVARSLKYKDLYSAMRHNVDERDKRVCPVSSASGTQQTTVINESGLYSLIMSSKLPKAKEFRHWVTSEILPSIARTGSYSVEEKPDSYMIENPAERARRWAEEYEEKRALEVKVTELEPKGQYFDSLVASKLLTTFRDTAKELHIPPRQFTQWLVDKGYVYRDRQNMIKPYEQYRKKRIIQNEGFSYTSRLFKRANICDSERKRNIQAFTFYGAVKSYFKIKPHPRTTLQKREQSPNSQKRAIRS